MIYQGYFLNEIDNIFKSRLNKKIAQHTLSVFLKTFTKEGYLNGNAGFIKWASLSKSTIYQKDKKGKGNYPIGVDTTKMKKSFIINYKSRGFEITNTAEHAVYFHLGDKNQPARPIIYNDISIHNDVIKMIDTEMQKLFEKTSKKLNSK